MNSNGRGEGDPAAAPYHHGMPSAAYDRWRTARAAVLDDVEVARASVGGLGHARHVLVQQVNRAYAVLLSAEFQGFCRDLHEGPDDGSPRPFRQPSRRSSNWSSCSTGRSTAATRTPVRSGPTSTASG